MSHAQSINHTGDFIVLLVGFKPWSTHKSNPSEIVAKELNNTCNSNIRNIRVCFKSIVIDVSHEGTSVVRNMLLNSYNDDNIEYDAILHMGLDPPTPGSIIKGLRFETVAENLLAQNTVGAPIFPGAKQNIIPSTMNWNQIQLSKLLLLLLNNNYNLQQNQLLIAKSFMEKNNDLHVSELWSNNAGKFYCNEAFYKTLYTIRDLQIKASSSLSNNKSTTELLPCTFVHLPVVSTVNLTIDKLLISRLGSYMVTTDDSNSQLLPTIVKKLYHDNNKKHVLLVAFSGHLDPDGDPGESIVEKMNNTCTSNNVICYNGLLIDYDDENSDLLKHMYNNNQLNQYDLVLILSPMIHQESLSYEYISIEVIASNGDSSVRSNNNISNDMVEEEKDNDKPNGILLLPSTINVGKIILDNVNNGNVAYGNWSRDVEDTLGNNIYYELLKAIRNPPSIESFQQQIVDASKYTKTKKKKIILNNDDNDDENDDNSNMLQSVLFQFNTYNNGCTRIFVLSSNFHFRKKSILISK